MELITPWLQNREYLFDICDEVNEEYYPHTSVRIKSTQSLQKVSQDELALYVAELLTVSEYNPVFGVLCMFKLEHKLRSNTNSVKRNCHEDLLANFKPQPVNSIGVDENEDKRVKKVIIKRLLKDHMPPTHVRSIVKSMLLRGSNTPFAHLRLRETPRTNRKNELIDLLESKYINAENALSSRSDLDSADDSTCDQGGADDFINVVDGNLSAYFHSKFLRKLGFNHCTSTPEVEITRQTKLFDSLISQSMHELIETVENAGLPMQNVHDQLPHISDKAIEESIHRMNCLVYILIKSTEALSELTGPVVMAADQRYVTYSGDSRLHLHEELLSNRACEYSLNWYIAYAAIYFLHLTMPFVFPQAYRLSSNSCLENWQRAHDVFCGVLVMSSVVQQHYALRMVKSQDVFHYDPGDDKDIIQSVAQGHHFKLIVKHEDQLVMERAAKLLSHHFRSITRKPLNCNFVMRAVEEFMDLPAPKDIHYDLSWDAFCKGCIGPLAAFDNPSYRSTSESTGTSSVDEPATDLVSHLMSWRRTMYLKLSENMAKYLIEYYEDMTIHDKSFILQTAEYCVQQAGSLGEADIYLGPPSVPLSGLFEAKDQNPMNDPMVILPYIAVDLLMNLKQCSKRLLSWEFRSGLKNCWLNQRFRDICHILEVIEECEQFRLITLPPREACPRLHSFDSKMLECSGQLRFKVSQLLSMQLKSLIKSNCFEIAKNLQRTDPKLHLCHYEADFLEANAIDYDLDGSSMLYDDIASLSSCSRRVSEEVCVSMICRWLEQILLELKNIISWNFLRSRMIVEPGETPPLRHTIRK